MFLPTIPELEEKNRLFESGAHTLTKDSFVFMSQLGSGAFGKVYKVSSKLTNQIYALKVLSKNQITNLNLSEQLKIEISILARCNHDNIIKLFCAFEDKGYIFLVMELANDSTLFNKIKKMRRLPEAMVADYMCDIVQAIIYLHSQNPIILHRDIKPENILINNGRCKIADFGWSNVDDEFRNTFCGTPDYLAPEMINGTGHNEKLDIWTLGVLMYELLHGQPPFSPKEKPNDARLVQKMIEKNILNGIIDFDPSISAEAKNAIIAMLKPNDVLRPSAKEVLELDFFKKHAKISMAKSPSGNTLLLPTSSNRAIVEGDSNLMRQKMREYEARIEALMTSNKHLNEVIESKDAALRSSKGDFEMLVPTFAKSVEDIKVLKEQFDIVSSENTALKSKFDPMRKELDALTAENRRFRHELAKQEETVSYLFKRTKNLSSTISDFYQTYVAELDLNMTQDHVLSYDNTLIKLESIFREFVEYKTKLLGVKLPPFRPEVIAKMKSERKPEPVQKTSNISSEQNQRRNSFSPRPGRSTSPLRNQMHKRSQPISEIDKNFLEYEEGSNRQFTKNSNR